MSSINRLDQVIKIKPTLSDQQIHVFLFQISLFNVDELSCYLSEEERSRSDKLRVQQKKAQFVITRGLLRIVLSNCINISPDAILFAYASYAKPGINTKILDQSVEFNVSHSGDYALIAVTLQHAIGVDIEKINPATDHQSLSNQFFSRQEKDELKGVNKEAQGRVFYQTWVRKESFIKAIGSGLGFGLEKFSVPMQKKIGVARAVVVDEPLEQDWFCYDLMCVNDYKTALTTSKQDVELIFYR